MTGKDSASVAPGGVRYKSISERLDALGLSGLRGVTTAIINEDNVVDIAASLDEGFQVVVMPPTSPPPEALLLPGDDYPAWKLITLGQVADDLTIIGDGEDVSESFFSAGEFSVNGQASLFDVIPSLAPGGWAALPVFSAAGLPESTFTLQVTTPEGSVPQWFLGD